MDLTNAFVTTALRFATSFARTTDQQFMHNHIGNPSLLDNAKIVADLDVTFVDPVDTLKDTMADMVKWGHVSPPAEK